MPKNYKILSKKEDILCFVGEIQKYADEERNAFGFLSRDAYETALYNEKILVAVTASEQEYVGHIFFGGVFPFGKVFQTLVKKEHRSRGVAQSLLNKLAALLEARGYTYITAKVATDLVAANKFYAGMGFETVRVKEGGKTTGRKINLRSMRLGNPTLFSWKNELSTVDNLSLPSIVSNRSPVYLIDLNVIFDAVKIRSRTEHAKALFNAGFQNLIRVAISEELLAELKRTSRDENDDPLLEMAQNFWVLGKPSQKEITQISNELGPVIFADRHRDKKITTQDKSDLVHLATAIKHAVSGFVTSEKKILSASDYLRNRYNIDVISPYEISELTDDVQEFSTSLIIGNMSYISTSDRDCHDIQSAIKALSISQNNLPGIDISRDEDVRHIVIKSEGQKCVAYAWWTCNKGPLPKNQAYFQISSGTENGDILVDFICDKITRECSRKNLSLVRLSVRTDNDIVRHAINKNGFRATLPKSTYETIYQKVCLGKPLLSENWQKIRLDIQRLTNGLKLPEYMPQLENPGDTIKLSNQSADEMPILLSDFEQLLYPTLYISGQTSGVVVPIKRSYADELFNTHEQLSLLTSKEAILRQERVYFSAPSTANTIHAGGIIFFYESGQEKGGRKAIIAAARVTQANVMLVDSLENDLLRRGVIDNSTLAQISPTGKMLVTFFEKIMPFRKNVSYNRLVDLGCNDGSNFVTAKRVTPDQVHSIIKEGLLDG